MEAAGIKLKPINCVAMEGLIEEAGDENGEIEAGSVLDAALIGAAQKVEPTKLLPTGPCARSRRD